MSWLLAAVLALYTAGVFWGGSVAGGPPVPQVSDKVTHFIVFLGLALVAWPCLARIKPIARRGNWVAVGAAAAYSIAVGGALEIVQAQLPYRSAEWLDWFADCAGALLGAVILGFGVKWKSSTSRANVLS